MNPPIEGKPLDEIISISNRLWRQVQTMKLPSPDMKLVMLGLLKIRDAAKMLQDQAQPKAAKVVDGKLPKQPRKPREARPTVVPNEVVGAADLSDLGMGVKT